MGITKIPKISVLMESNAAALVLKVGNLIQEVHYRARGPMVFKNRLWPVLCMLVFASLFSQPVCAQPGPQHIVSLEVRCMRTSQILIGYPAKFEVIESGDYDSLVEITISAREWLKGEAKPTAALRIRFNKWDRQKLETWIEDEEEFLFFISDAPKQSNWYFSAVFRPLHKPDQNAFFWRMSKPVRGTQQDLLKSTRAALRANREIADKQGESPSLNLRFRYRLSIALPIDSRFPLAIENIFENPTFGNSSVDERVVEQITAPNILERVDRKKLEEMLKRLAKQEKPYQFRTQTNEVIELHESYPLSDAIGKVLTKWDDGFDQSSIPKSSVTTVTKDKSEFDTIAKLLKNKRSPNEIGYYAVNRRMTVTYNSKNKQEDKALRSPARIKSIYFSKESLDKDGGVLPDLSSLKAVSSVSIDLTGKETVDLSPLRDLKGSLQYLEIAGGGPEVDLAPLGDLTNLVSIELLGSKVTGFSFLKSLEKLERLSRLITDDLRPLAGLKNLKELSVAHSDLTDLSPLSKLNNLETLTIGSGKPVDLSPLSDLAQLKVLACSYSKVDNITPLAKLVNLENIDLRRTQVSDLSSLKDMQKLKILRLQEAKQLKSIAPLSGLRSLEELNLEKTNVADLSPLAKVKSLQSIDARDTPANDVSKLADLENLKRLWLADLKEVLGAERLRYIDGLQLGFGTRDHWQYKKLKLERKHLCDHAAMVMSKSLFEKCRDASLDMPETDANYLKAATVLRRVGAMKIVAVSRADLCTNPIFSKLTEAEIQKLVQQENDFIASLARERVEDVVGGFAVDPKSSFSLEETKRCLDSGNFQFASLNLINSPNAVESIQPILAACGEKQIPILLHVDLQKVAAKPGDAGAFFEMIAKSASGARVVFVTANVTPATLQSFLDGLKKVSSRLQNYRCCVTGDWYQESVDVDIKQWKPIADNMRELGLDHFLIGSGFNVTRAWKFDQILKQQLELNFTETRTIRSNVLVPSK